MAVSMRVQGGAVTSNKGAGAAVRRAAAVPAGIARGARRSAWPAHTGGVAAAASEGPAAWKRRGLAGGRRLGGGGRV
jgi:hypothetical protein